MKLAAVALDYDGTIARDGKFDPSVRGAVADARKREVVVALVTGGRLVDLRRLVDLACFDVVERYSSSRQAVARFSWLILGSGSVLSVIKTSPSAKSLRCSGLSIIRPLPLAICSATARISR
jgi:hypothetical protein